MRESEQYLMLSITAKMLREDVIKRSSEVERISKTGAGLWEGDQWHSTTFREQQRQKELAIRYLELIREKSENISILTPPGQNEAVELGHMVKTRLLDDKEIQNVGLPYVRIHVLSPTDTQYLNRVFDNQAEIVVSNLSPLGKALVGAKRGQTVIYLDRLRAQVSEDIDAIQVSTLFGMT